MVKTGESLKKIPERARQRQEQSNYSMPQSVNGFSVVQQKAIAGKLQRTLGNQFLQRAVSSEISLDFANSKISQSFHGTDIIRRRLLGNVNASGLQVQVHTRTIAGWRTLLSDADTYYNALKLNAFMAKAVGHNQFTEAESERASHQKALLQPMQTPNDQECINLMFAMLSTESVDLREIGSDMPAITGYLLQRFINQFYQPTVSYAAQQMATAQDPRQWRLDPSRVASFVDEAEDVYGSTKNLAPHHISDVLIGPNYAENRLSTIGVHGTRQAPASPVAELQLQALVGAQHAIATAFNYVTMNGETEAGTAAEKAQRYIRNHARVLRGIVEHKQKVEQMQQATIAAVVGVAFAAAGPIAQSFNFLGKLIATEVTRNAVEQAILEVAALSVGAMASTLVSASSEQMESSFRDSFDNTIQIWLNKIGERPRRDNEPRIPNGIMLVANSLQGSFLYHSA